MRIIYWSVIYYYAQRQRMKNNQNPDFVLNFDLLTSDTAIKNTEDNKDI